MSTGFLKKAAFKNTSVYHQAPIPARYLLKMGETEKATVHINQSRFEIYCEKLKINPNLFMLKVTLFMMYGGKKLSFKN